MPKDDVRNRAKHLLIGSVEAHSGKSAMVLAILHQLKSRGYNLGYGKPLGTCLDNPLGASCQSPHGTPDLVDEDVRFLASSLSLASEQLYPTLLLLDQQTIQERMRGDNAVDYRELLSKYQTESSHDLIVVEGPGTLDEGYLFHLSLRETAEALNAAVVLVSRFTEPWSVDSILGAKQRLGDAVLGVVFNDVPKKHIKTVQTVIKPYLEARNILVLGIVPHSELLRSVSVAELVHRLDATVLCSKERLDLMVESLCIGAMNVNSALKYFRKGHNMAVVTGGDRTDLQLAALETSTQCLILTGRVAPRQDILTRAEEMEIPILTVDLDTLTTVELIDKAFSEVRFHEQVKAQCISQMSSTYLDIDRLTQALGLT